MTQFVTASDLTATVVASSPAGVLIERKGTSTTNVFKVRKAFKGYEIVTPVAGQRLARYDDIKKVKKFLTSF